jgi:ProP effector
VVFPWIEEEEIVRPNIKEAYATLELLAATWPNCFSVKLADRRPLKVGIAKDIATAAEGAITPEELGAALHVYTSHKRYLRTLQEGAQRVDLDGNAVGTVTAEQAAAARRRIERIEARHSARVRTNGLAAEAAKRAAQEAERAAEVAAGKRKPVLRLPRTATAAAA